MRVKICGLKTTETMAAALEAGCDLVGLVQFTKSPRHIALEAARPLADLARSHADIVVLVVDADDDAIAEIMSRVRPDLLQLHGKETPERTRAIRTLAGIPVMKAIAVETTADAAHALAYRGIADHILFDAKAPKDAAHPGGNGIAFDWRALEEIKHQVPSWMLSGGLTADNVATGITLTGATAVDVSSGVESAPGVKDIDKIRAFVTAAKQARRSS